MHKLFYCLLANYKNILIENYQLKMCKKKCLAKGLVVVIVRFVIIIKQSLNIKVYYNNKAIKTKEVLYLVKLLNHAPG